MRAVVAERHGTVWQGRHLRVPLLLALTAGPAAVEAAVLVSVGNRSALALAPQAGAPNPFGVFHDLRWVLVYHDSWLTFAAALLGAVGLRTLLTVAIVVLAWPSGRERPSVSRLAGTALALTAVTAVALGPWAAITVAAGVTALSWFTVGSVLAVLVLALVLQRGPMTGTWWRGLPPPTTVLWAVATFVALTLGAVVVDQVTGWAVVPLAAAVGAVNAPLWRGLVRSAVLARPRLPRLPTVPAVVLVLLAALAASGVLARSGSQAAARPPPPLLLRDGAPAPRQALLYVGGYDSRYDGVTPYAADPAGRPALPVLRFSYAGLDGQGRPLPYGPADTHQPLTRSAELLAAQVAEVRRRAGRPVALLGHSEGSLVVRTYLDSLAGPVDGRPPDVEAVALLSPLPQPARVYYPPPDARTGWGVATGWVLRGIFAAVRRTGGNGLGTDDPFARSLLDGAPRYRERMLCPVPGVRMIAVLPLLDAIADPPGPDPRIPVFVVPERHAMDYGRAATQRHLVAFLNGQPPGPYRGLAYPVLRAAGAAWQAPPLSVGLNRVWRAPQGGPRLPDCE
ncbi:esterase/lipase family protein [Plantactinospora sp. CA-290183]|uniref:esterase/lipase family protein n=1 Tax=Plantactinospora sp. CA-290183 TaxID=3240006 RepID=UPI003D8E7EAD